jgi:hypothetical protein
MTWQGGQVPEQSIYSGVRQVPRQPIAYPVTRGNLASVVRGELRYIRHLGDDTEELFDRIVDPMERRNRIDDAGLRAAVATFRAETESWFRPEP